MRIALIGLGLLLMAASLFYDTSAIGGEVVSLDKMSDRQILFSSGAVFFLAGVLLSGAHQIVAAIRNGQKGAAEAPSQTEGRSLPGYVVGGRRPEKPKA